MTSLFQPTTFHPTTTQSAFVLCLLVSACSFNTNNQLASDGDVVGSADASALADGAITDGGVAQPDSAMGAPDGAPDAGPPPFCDSSDQDLVLCLTFDDLASNPSTIPDGSGYADINIVSISNGAIVLGQNGDALRTAQGFTSSIDANSNLDAAKTIEMWIKPNGLDRDFQGLFEGNDYWFYLNRNGALSCDFYTSLQLPEDVYTNEGVVTSGVWQHVACVMDATSTRIFLNGVKVDGRTDGPALQFANATTNRYSFGRGSLYWGAMVRLVGDVDSLRVWKTDRSGQLCPECSQPSM